MKNFNTPANPDLDAARFLNIFKKDENRISLVFIPADPDKHKTMWGVFSNVDSAVFIAREFVDTNIEKRYNVYFHINRISQDFEAMNLIVPAKSGGLPGNDDIDRITTICIDIDPPKGSPRPVPGGTLKNCIETAKTLVSELMKEHFPAGFIISSGNGAQIFFKCDYESDVIGDPIGKKTIRYIESIQQELFGSLILDKSVGNAARIMRLPGFRNFKGQALDESADSFRYAMNITDPDSYSTGMIAPGKFEVIEKYYEENEHLFEEKELEGITPEQLKEIDNIVPYENRIDRAIAYCSMMEGAKEGSRRSDLFVKSQKISRGLVISVDDTIDIMHRHWNLEKNDPPLPRDLMERHVRNGAANGQTTPVGALLVGDMLKKEIEGYAEEMIQRLNANMTSDDIIASRSIALFSARSTAKNNAAIMDGKKGKSAKLEESLIWAPGGNKNKFNSILKYCKQVSAGRNNAGPLSAALTIAGGALGKRFSPPLYHSNMSHAGVWVLNVSETGSGKNAPLSAVKRCFTEAGFPDIIAGDGVASAQSIEKELALRPMTATVYTFDEVGEMFGTIKGSNSSWMSQIKQELKQLYSRDKKVKAQAMQSAKVLEDRGVKLEGNTLIIERPVIPICGAMTPNHMSTMFTASDLSDGFANRWLVFTDAFGGDYEPPENPYAKGNVEVRIPKAVTEFIRDALGAADWYINTDEGEDEDHGVNLPKFDIANVNIAKLTPEAEKLQYKEICRIDKAQRQMRDDGDYAKADMLGRVCENAIRMATISAACRADNLNKDIVIDHDDVKWAQRLALHSAYTFSVLLPEASEIQTSFSASYDKFMNAIRGAYERIPENIRASGELVYRKDIRNLIKRIPARFQDDIVNTAARAGELRVFEGNDLRDVMLNLGYNQKNISQNDIAYMPVYDPSHVRFNEVLEGKEYRKVKQL